MESAKSKDASDTKTNCALNVRPSTSVRMGNAFFGIALIGQMTSAFLASRGFETKVEFAENKNHKSVLVDS